MNNNNLYDFLSLLRIFCEDVWCLGPGKLVATPPSGEIPDKVLNLWNDMTPEEKEFVTQVYFPYFSESKSPLSIHVASTDSIEEIKKEDKIVIVATRIFFYLEEYLKLFLEVYENEMRENLEFVNLLNMIHFYQGAPFWNDIIKILFNQSYDSELNTVAGKIIKLSYSQKLQEKGLHYTRSFCRNPTQQEINESLKIFKEINTKPSFMKQGGSKRNKKRKRNKRRRSIKHHVIPPVGPS